MTRFDGRRSERLEQLLFDCGIWIVALDGLQRGERLRVALQYALRLSGPVENVVAEQRVAFRFREPRQRLLRAIIVVVVVAQRQRRSRAPHVAGIFRCKCGKFFVRAGRGVVQRASKARELPLRGFIFRRSGSNFRSGSIGRATRAARDRLRLIRFFLFRVGLLSWDVERHSGQQRDTHKDRHKAGEINGPRFCSRHFAANTAVARARSKTPV